jgi:hypothetical protein
LDGDNRKDKFEKISELKISTPIEVLCENQPGNENL